MTTQFQVLRLTSRLLVQVRTAEVWGTPEGSCPTLTARHVLRLIGRTRTSVFFDPNEAGWPLPYYQIALVRSDPMAVATDQITLRDFFQKSLQASGVRKSSRVEPLDLSWSMIVIHDVVRITNSAVHAWVTLFQLLERVP